jgi:hypothetical protein
MKLTVQMKVGPKTIVTVEGENLKEIHQCLAEAAEVYAEPSCGLCQSAEIVPNFRQVGDDKYYELKCRKCGGRLALGQPKKGNGLYPKRKVDPKTGMPTKTTDPRGVFDGEHFGWHKFDPNAVAAD